MNTHLHTLDTLPSITPAQLDALHRLGVITLADLLSFSPVRQARAVQAWRDGLLRANEVTVYLHESARDKSAETLLNGPLQVLAAVSVEVAAEISRLDLHTVADLARYAAFAEAERVISGSGNPDNTETDPCGPRCVVPTCRQFTRNTKRYVSYFRQVELRGLSISLSSDLHVKGVSLLPLAHLFDYRAYEPRTIHLGYSVVYQQDWIYTGIHLGEPRGGVSMLMGQDTQISVLDFQRITRASQQENNSATERLTNVLIHTRAVDEVARATAEEHQQGGTSGFGANAATAGSFTAAGAVIGGVGGGISGALAGLVIGNVANAAGGLPTIGGAIAGAAIGSAAGAAAGSLIASGAATLGFVETDAEGDREIFARSAQNIQQRTVQNASSIRSFWSSIVSQSLQSEEQTIRTDRVTNHNRIHALNALYFEVLASYHVNLQPIDFDALLFLPFKPLSFTATTLGQFWWIIRNSLGDPALVASLDQHFLTLGTDLSLDAQGQALPVPADILSLKITVKVDLDGSAIQSAIGTAIAASLGLAFINLPGAVVGILGSLCNNFIDGLKRDKVTVSLITSLTGEDEEINLSRSASPNSDPDFVGTFTTSKSVPLASITKVRIRNNNPNQKINFGLGEIDFGEVHFEDITAKVTIANKARFRPHVPGIDALEATTIISDKLTVRSASSKRVSWSIADQLADAFQGVNEAGDAADDAQDLVAAQIENLLGFLNANCFTFTRLIMQTVEREQVAAILELLEINGEPLSRIAGTTPIGFTSNQVILPLKKRGGFAKKYESTNWDTTKLRTLLESISERDFKSPKSIDVQLGRLLSACNAFLSETSGSNAPNTPFEVSLRAQVVQLHQLIQRLQVALGGLRSIFVATNQLNELLELIASILHRLRRPAHGTSQKMAILIGYSEDLRRDLAPRMGKIISSDEVALPTPSVFMEPVLSHSKGAELYDMRRNSHYDLLEAPGIAAADPNTLRGQNISLAPTVPGAVLQQQEPPQLPLPGNLAAALSEAGRLNLDTLINTNAASFQNIVSTLATLSAELAKASATLTGDAQRQVLQAATDVSKQVGGLVESGLGQASQLAQSRPAPATQQQTPPSAAPAPPATQQEKAEVVREQERIDKSRATPIQKAERKAAIGAPTRGSASLNYRFKLTFFDQFGSLLPEGSLTATLAFASPNSPGTTNIVDLNGGQEPIPLNLPGGFITTEQITLEPGRLFTFAFNTDINGNNLPGSADLRLPTNPDVLLHVRLGFTTEKVTTTNVITKLIERSLTNTFGLAGQAILESLLNGSVKFPLYKVFEITAGGSVKQALDLKAEFERVSGETDTDTDTDTTAREYEMLIPTGWLVTVNPL